MSSSYNNSISSSSALSFRFSGASTGENNFNSGETVMTMIQKPNSVSPPPKRLRNKPGNPSPDAEVIALSPEEIMATNRFPCEVCNKRFPREQNLQLHRRGHNLPWTLKQKSEEEVRKKVYVCPEPTCVYHDPSRALGDITGIKKHYCRKHGEKKFKCEQCPKSYAVESDFKAHSKICGTKEYRCYCGTTFTRRDSYDTHRAFCDVLQESARNPTVSNKEITVAAAGGGGGRPFFFRGASSALSHNRFGKTSNTGYTPLARGYNLNRSSPETFGDFFPQSTNPNHGPTNFPMQYPSNQGLLARNDQNLMNQKGLINNNNNLLNPGYFQDKTVTRNLSAQTGVPSLFNHADNNVPSALLGGFSSSSPSANVVVNTFGGSGNANFQVQMNSLAATSGLQGRPGSSVFVLENNLTDRETLDFLGVNGRGGDRNGPPLDVDMKYPDPNNPYGGV